MELTQKYGKHSNFRWLTLNCVIDKIGSKEQLSKN